MMAQFVKLFVLASVATRTALNEDQDDIGIKVGEEWESMWGCAALAAH